MNHRIALALATILFAQVPFSALFAEAIAKFDENTPLFLVASYDEPGAVSLTADSIIFDVIPDGGAFAGVAGTLNVPAIAFLPSEYQWESRFRLLSEYNLPGFGAVYSDMDEGYLVDEAWVFHFDTSALTPANDWVVRRQSFNNPVVQGNNDGVQNPGLKLIGLVGDNVADARLHLELDYLRIVPIPEPQSILLLLLGAAIATTSLGDKCRDSSLFGL